MDSMEESLKKRWSALFQFVNLAPFGALFWVAEEVWNTLADSKYIRNETRSGHPGCSIRRLHSTLGFVPMLHGTSGKSKSKELIAVKDVFATEHTTWFGGLDPLPMAFDLWRDEAKIKPAKKKRADASELQALEALCARRGW